MIRFFLLFILLLMAPFFPAFPQTRKIVAIGSSTTAGYKASPIDSAWVNRVNHYYKTVLHLLDTVYNLGVPDNTFYSAMPSSYKNTIRFIRPDVNKNVTKATTLLKGLSDPANGVIIVNFPSNGYDYMSVEEVINGLQIIYDSATRYGNRCFITTTQPRTDGKFATSLIKKRMAAIKDAIIQRFGAEHTLNFWDGMYNPADTTILSKYSAGDNIHFNNRGHNVLFQRVVQKNVLNVAITAVAENPVATRINLYPNPTREQCFITVAHEAKAANVFNAKGEVIQSVVLQPTGPTCSGTIDMSGEDAGFYFVEILVDNRIEMVRLIKE